MPRTIVRKTFLSALAGAATSLGGFLSMVLIARLLGVAETGAIAYAIWLTSLIVTLLDFGVHSTLARFLPQLVAGHEEKRADRLTAALFRPYAAACVVAFAGLCVYAAWPLANPSDRPASEAFLVATLVLLQALANFALGYLRGMQRFETSAAMTVLSFGLQIACVAIGGRFWGGAGVLAGYCVGSAPLAIRAVRWLWRRHVDMRVIEPQIVRFAAFSWLGALAAAFVWSRSEVFFLQRSWGAESVGILTVGLTFSNIAAQGPLLLTGALLAFFSERVETQPLDVINKAFAAGTRMLAFLALPLGFGTAAVLPALVPLLYGSAFDSAVEPAEIVVAAAAFAASGAVGTHMMCARNRSDFIFYSNILGAALSIAAGLTVIPGYGVLGAAASRAAVQMFMLGLGLWFIARRLNCPVPFRHLARLAASAALCGVAARAVLQLVHGPLALPIAIGVGALVYWAAVRMLDALPPEDVERLRAIGARSPRVVQRLFDRALSFLSRAPRTVEVAE